MAVYRYKDEKRDKFWRIEYLDNELVVNYGKTGTIGKYKVKEFENEEDCQKEVKKLIESKIKKEYEPYEDFDLYNHFYFDDEEMGLHPLTSHPNFRKYFIDDLYYDCGDEETPFGSDEGSDTLYILTKYFRNKKSFDISNFPKNLIEKEWDMVYFPAIDLSREKVEEQISFDEMNTINSDMITYSTAFAQIKITGKIDGILKVLALNAMKRMQISASILGWDYFGESSEIIQKMIEDLKKFPIIS